ncbi:hypothetical protein BC628DRAFT_982972 [Trametes gibbosa]|uniref:C2H2-type domain-containing protein n=1 Tax=Trametes gibbosa TaxID=160864 RepID=A0A6G6FSD2_9APHY|nr:hypothetical protein BC628DRAFT_982972 [Trametes gibbosa]QIE48491.1 hypothetical protein [Trametes gibbosa]
MASSITLPDFDFLNAPGEEYNDEEGYEDGEGEEDYDEGEDIDAEAEEMARRLGDQLLADIAKAQAEAAATSASMSSTQGPPAHAHSEGPTQSTYRKKQDAALLTMKAILAFAAKNPVVHSAMSSSHVPGVEAASLPEVFNRCISASSISKPLARTLTEIVLTLAKSEVLFGSLRNSDAPALQLDKGKRKRDQADEGGRHIELGSSFPQKRIAIDQPDLLHLLSDAVRVISHALSSAPVHRPSVDPGLISSIQLQLHQVFLFSVTSAPRAIDGRMPALQELAGLVQMLGVLSGIHIGHPPMHHPPHWHPHPGAPPPPPDIGTAVYPCLVPGCSKTFHRLYSLRTHQRFHTLEHRPYRCMQCPASFVRNHDLKRHALLHERRAWRCAGCSKIFSRRDAIKRHKDARGRGGKGRSGEAEPVNTACAYAEIEEVEIEKADGDEEMSRRAKLWNGIAASTTGGMPMGDHAGPEEGEIDPRILFDAQNIVLSIHGLLQAEVSKGIGPPSAPAPMPPPNVSQSTLASIIARAQQTAIPQELVAPPFSAPELPAPVPSAEMPMAVDMPSEPPGEAPAVTAEHTDTSSTPPALSLSWLSEEQTKLLEQAIAQAASAAQAQAEAEAALEEEDEDFDDEEQDELEVEE